MVNATAKYVRVSPRKAGDMTRLIRGKKVAEAKAILALSPRAAAKLVGKVLDMFHIENRLFHRWGSNTLNKVIALKT